MCGITGIVGRLALGESEHAAVVRMNAALYHRGPDGDGAIVAPNLHVAMRRLSIIDLAGGWQPLYNEDSTVAVICNGEIYNHVELRASLESRGHRFRTHSDCETIAHLYEEHGEECVHHLRGMFAFALYDAKARKILLARDRMGEKPVYLLERDGMIAFSSEMASLLRSGMIRFEVDPAAVKLYMHYGYVPEPATAVKGVRKLPAGHLLSIDLDRWNVSQRCYWRLADAPPIDADPVARIREELDTIAELIIRADVPVGVGLSGGLDSSAIAAMASRRRPGKIHALSVGYTGRPSVDERHEAQETAKLLGMPFHEVEISDREVAELFPERAAWRDDPIADIAGHGYYALSRLARDKGIPVLLKGQGADELFWGYGWLRDALRLSMLKDAQGGSPVHESFRSNIFPSSISPAGLREFAAKKAGQAMGWDRGLNDGNAPADQLVFYNAARTYQRGAAAYPRIISSEWQHAAAHANPAAIFTVPRPWNDLPTMLTSLACATYLLENGMVQGDRLSMVNSVELRLPLCDYRLAETVIGLRKARPDHDLAPKEWFRKAIRPLLPEQILNRPKRGFTPPGTKWIRLLVETYKVSLRNGFLVESGILTPQGAQTLTEPHSRASMWPETAYKCLVLEFWCRAMQQAANVGPVPSTYRTPACAYEAYTRHRDIKSKEPVSLAS